MENQQLILDNIAKHISLNNDEKTYFLSLLQAKTYKRRQLLLNAGDVSRDSIFVCKGCLRGFTTDHNGFEHILNFAPPNWWIADLYSLISQQPAVLNIEAIEESEVLLLSKENQEKLYAAIPKFERFFRIITEKSLITHQQRLLNNLSLTAEARYETFCHRYPTLINCLPQKYIAAYIGVTPEFFSKMRSRLLRSSDAKNNNK